jgi:hypothetical protein
MKKICKYSLLLAVLVLFSNSIIAQVSFGLRGAVNMFNMTVKDNDDDKITTQMAPAWNAGLFAEIPLSPEFYVRPELSFAQKGYKNEDANDTKTTLSYVELPVTLLYKGALSGGNVLVGFGPYIAMGIGGKVKNGGTSTVKFKNDITMQEAASNPYYKPLDAGAKVYAGYEFASGLSFTIESSLGLVNIMPEIGGNQNGDAKNVGFGIGIGYKFR